MRWVRTALILTAYSFLLLCLIGLATVNYWFELRIVKNRGFRIDKVSKWINIEGSLMNDGDWQGVTNKEVWLRQACTVYKNQLWRSGEKRQRNKVKFNKRMHILIKTRGLQCWSELSLTYGSMCLVPSNNCFLCSSEIFREARLASNFSVLYFS